MIRSNQEYKTSDGFALNQLNHHKRSTRANLRNIDMFDNKINLQANDSLNSTLGREKPNKNRSSNT